MYQEDIKSQDIKSQDNELMFNPFNEQNKEITENEVSNILKQYNLSGKINNIKLYKRAFIHKSYTKKPAIENEIQNIKVVDCPDNCLPLKQISNERLEFLGDGILEAITKFYLYRRFPKENEGFMTEKKIALVKNESIGKMAYDMKLNYWYIISRHAEEKKTRTNLKKLGCLFEAFLGALFLDHNKNYKNDDDYNDYNDYNDIFITGPGFQAAQQFVEAVFEKHVNWIDLIKNDDNYKNLLQVKIQKLFKVTPDYIEYEYNNETGYHVGVVLCLGQEIYEVSENEKIIFNSNYSLEMLREIYDKNDKLYVVLGEGHHKIKKKAEQVACEKILELI